jgi:hypothetical protein
MSNFFVIGLPRSRTAWLANFLTYDGNFCYHEGVGGCSTIEEYKDKLGKDKGDSNTGLMMFDFEKYFPDVKVIVIDSTIDNAVEFAEKVYGTDIKKSMLKAKDRLDSIKGLHISLDDINDSLKKIWEYVSVKPFNKDRADMLVKLNIQVNDPFDFDIEAIHKLRGNVDGWLA